VLALWERCGALPVGSDGLTAEQALELMACAAAVTVLAERDGQIVGAAVGTATGPLGFIHRLAVPPGREGDELAELVLERLERSLQERGVRKFAVMAAEGGERRQFEGRGYVTVGGVRYLERLASSPR
jgi:N-acetylglutamate synthase-like GNAT family acetyltransferase